MCLQRQLAKVPTPSYIGKINCTHLDLGNSPPLAQNVHLLPMDSEGGWGLEADVEYYGGAILTIETRIDVRDSNAREKVVVQGLEQTLTGQPSVDLLNRGFESLKTDFHIAVDDGSSAGDQRNGGAPDQGNGGGTSTSSRPGNCYWAACFWGTSLDIEGSKPGGCSHFHHVSLSFFFILLWGYCSCLYLREIRFTSLFISKFGSRCDQT